MGNGTPPLERYRGSPQTLCYCFGTKASTAWNSAGRSAVATAALHRRCAKRVQRHAATTTKSIDVRLVAVVRTKMSRASATTNWRLLHGLRQRPRIHERQISPLTCKERQIPRVRTRTKNSVWTDCPSTDRAVGLLREHSHPRTQRCHL